VRLIILPWVQYLAMADPSEHQPTLHPFSELLASLNAPKAPLNQLAQWLSSNPHPSPGPDPEGPPSFLTPGDSSVSIQDLIRQESRGLPPRPSGRMTRFSTAAASLPTEVVERSPFTSLSHDLKDRGIGWNICCKCHQRTSVEAGHEFAGNEWECTMNTWNPGMAECCTEQDFKRRYAQCADAETRSLKLTPTINGVPVNFHWLYNMVTQMGGWETVKTFGWLPLIYEEQKWTSSSIAHRLKHLFESHLLEFERRFFKGKRYDTPQQQSLLFRPLPQLHHFFTDQMEHRVTYRRSVHQPRRAAQRQRGLVPHTTSWNQYLGAMPHMTMPAMAPQVQGLMDPNQYQYLMQFMNYGQAPSTFGPMPGVLPGLNLGLAASVATVGAPEGANQSHSSNRDAEVENDAHEHAPKRSRRLPATHPVKLSCIAWNVCARCRQMAAVEAPFPVVRNRPWHCEENGWNVALARCCPEPEWNEAYANTVPAKTRPTYPPIIDGHTINLWRLYNVVTQLGGLKSVIRHNMLAHVCLVIGTAETFTHRLKLLYEKYLLAFEEVAFRGNRYDGPEGLDALQRPREAVLEPETSTVDPTADPIAPTPSAAGGPIPSAAAGNGVTTPLLVPEASRNDGKSLECDSPSQVEGDTTPSPFGDEIPNDRMPPDDP